MFARSPFRRRTTPTPTPRAILLLIPLACLSLLWAGCSDTTAPAKEAGNVLDPGTGSLALKDITFVDPGGRTLLLRLEGSEMMSDPEAGTVSLAVSVRNLSDQAIAPPLVVWIGDLRPADVAPLNADLTRPPANTDPAIADTVRVAYGFDYTELLAGAPLAAGEATPPKTWTFADPALGPFAFAAHAEGGDPGGAARLGGRCFTDLNRNGRPDRGEPPFTAGGVQVTGPDGVTSWAACDPDGRWAVPVSLPGLYEARFESYAMTPLPIWLTTPNPLSVVIPAGPDGGPGSWLNADFGVAPVGPPPPPGDVVGFTDLRPSALHREPWQFLGAEVSDAHLLVRVGFSGCQPEHRFRLWMSGGFAESSPPRANLTLVHETQEECAAAFTNALPFDLTPLCARYVEQFGPGPLVLVLHDPDGSTHEFPMAVARPDSVPPPGAP